MSTPHGLQNSATGRPEALLHGATTATPHARKMQCLMDLANRTNDAILITDADGRIEWINVRFTELTGYTLGEIAGQRPGALLQGPLSDLHVSERLRDAVRQGQPIVEEIINYRKDGSTFHVRLDIRPFRDETGLLSGFMGVQTDVTQLVAQQHQIASAEARLRAAIEGAELFAWEFCVEEDRYTYVSFEEEHLGYSREFWMQPGFWQSLICNDDRDRALRTRQAAVREGRSHRISYRIGANDGRLLHISDYVSAPEIIHGRTIVRGVMVDVTEIQQARETQYAQSERLDLAVTATGLGMWDWNPKTGLLVVSDQWAAILGYHPDELARDTSAFLDRVHPSDLARVQQAIHDAIYYTIPYCVELRLAHRDGSWRWVIAKGRVIARNAHGEVTRFVGTHLDITARKRAEDELQHLTETLEEAQAIGRIGNWQMDISTGKITWSKQLFQMLNVASSQGEFDYGGSLDLFVDEDALRLAQTIGRAVEDGKPYTMLVRLKEPINGMRFLRADGRAKQDSSGKVVSLFGTVADVTAAIEREEALKIARNQAEAANQAKSQFLANMSHEIRTPLTAILGFTDLLREDNNHLTAPQRSQAIDTIKNAGQHLLTVINDILDLSKIEANRMAIERIETNLIDVAHEVERLMRPHAQGKGLKLNVRLASPVPQQIYSDPTRLRQIMMNLLGNAVKFTESGQITLTLGQASDGADLQVDVEDTGVGMTAAESERLFQPFGQADGTVTRRYGGTGLGLTISRRLAEIMGGTVALVRSEPGAGSHFRLIVPMQAVAGTALVSRLEARGPSRDAGTVHTLEPLAGRILLAEDGTDNQRLIQFYLTKSGATVDVADNGRIALEMIDRADRSGQPYDLLLTDMQMPEMDGYALARHLRGQRHAIPIVALTAHAMAENRTQCIDAGCDDYVSKPIDRSQLLSVCKKWMTVATAKAA